MSDREMAPVSKGRREEELDDLLEALLEARHRLGLAGKAISADALAGSASVLAESARALSRQAERLDPSPWHKKLWRRMTRPS